MTLTGTIPDFRIYYFGFYLYLMDKGVTLKTLSETKPSNQPWYIYSN